MSALRNIASAVSVSLFFACSGSPVDSDRDAHALDGGSDVADLGADPDIMPDILPAAGLSTCAETLDALLDRLALLAPSREDNHDATPPAALRDAFILSVASGASAQWGAATLAASNVGYTLCAVDMDMSEVRWVPTDFAAGFPILLLRFGSEIPELVLQHPHPFFDGTLEGAAAWWEATGARAMIVSGAHRCSSLTASACGGTTSVCGGGPSAYLESDPAHSTGTLFHAAHIALSDAFPVATVVSLHGTSQDVAYVADGTRGRGASDNLVSEVLDRLTVAFPGVEMRSCDEYDSGISGPWLCGTTNVQGRHLNGSADECSSAATRPSGRFIHLEQPVSMRSDPRAVAISTAPAP